MISTLMHLARLVQTGPDAVKFHLYAHPCSYGDKHEQCFYRRVIVDEVKEEFTFTLDPSDFIHDCLEDARAMLYKGCPSDTTGKRFYTFGDIFITKELKDQTKKSKRKDPQQDNPWKIKGNFSFSDDGNTFEDSSELFDDDKHPIVEKFREAFPSIIPAIKGLIENLPFTEKKNSLYIFFDFSSLGVNHWYEFDGVLGYLDRLFLNYYQTKVKPDSRMFFETPQGYTLQKTFIHTLCSGDEKSDEQSPGFTSKDQYRCLSFSADERELLYYIKKILVECEVAIPRCSPNKIRVLPSGDELTYDDFKTFLDNLPKYVSDDGNDEDKAEKTLALIENNDFFAALDPPTKKIIAFDIIFFRKGLKTPDMDILELSNLQRSHLNKVITRINEIRNKISEETKWKPNKLWKAFYNLLGSDLKKSADSRYKAHMIKVLPKILRGQYYRDPYLLTYMIEKVSHRLRNGVEPRIKDLITDLTFIHNIQQGSDPMLHEKSAELGKQSANLAFPLKKLFTGNFEKRTMGFLTRRAASTDNVRELLINWNETVNRHIGEEKNGYQVKLNSYAFTQALSIIQEIDSEKTFDKNSFIEGFIKQIYFLDFVSNKSATN